MLKTLEPTYLDSLGRPVYDLTGHFVELYGKEVVKAEQRESNVLILERHSSGYMVAYRWLRDPEDLTSVKGSETSCWTEKEVDMSRGLFEQFRLFP